MVLINEDLYIPYKRTNIVRSASVIPGLALLAVGFVGCNRTLAVVCMTISITFIGAMFSGYLSNHIDIAPNFAGTLMGITNTFASIPGFIVPVFVGYVTNNNETVSQWRIVWYVTLGLYAVVAVFYTIFASGLEQPWNKPKEEQSS